MEADEDRCGGPLLCPLLEFGLLGGPGLLDGEDPCPVDLGFSATEVIIITFVFVFFCFFV